MQTEYPEKYKDLGLKIAYCRKKRGYTQEALAEMINKSPNFLAQVESTGTTKGISLELSLIHICSRYLVLRMVSGCISGDSWARFRYSMGSDAV